MAETVLEAQKRGWAQHLGERFYLRRVIRAQFHTVWIHLEPEALALRRLPPAQRTPLIYTSTHVSWWDGYLAWFVNHALGTRDAYLMMDVTSLQHYWFFTWLGAYGVDRTNPRAALASIEYSANLLKEAPNRAIWIFPQGTIIPADRRPLGLFPGVAHIARRLPACDILPIAIRLEYRYEQRAEVFIRVGAPIHLTEAQRLSSRELTAQVDVALTAEADRLHDEMTNGDIARPLPGYAPLMRGRPSSNRIWENVQATARRALGRPALPPAP